MADTNMVNNDSMILVLSLTQVLSTIPHHNHQQQQEHQLQLPQDLIVKLN
jgi:hypothetical protein